VVRYEISAPLGRTGRPISNRETIAGDHMRVHWSVAFAALIALFASTAFAPPARAADSAMATQLCDLVKKLVPEVRDYQPAGAKAQLVMALHEKYEDDLDTLRQARAEIDSATTASCPKDREALLAVLKTPTLKDGLQ
jgi:hypothetical protein